MQERCNNKMEDTGSTYRCEYPERHPGPHSNGSWERWVDEGKEVAMSNIDSAERLVAHNLLLYADTIDEKYREDHFDSRNKDEWVSGFCEWLADKQRKSAEVRASND